MMTTHDRPIAPRRQTVLIAVLAALAVVGCGTDPGATTERAAVASVEPTDLLVASPSPVPAGYALPCAADRRPPSRVSRRLPRRPRRPTHVPGRTRSTCTDAAITWPSTPSSGASGRASRWRSTWRRARRSRRVPTRRSSGRWPRRARAARSAAPTRAAGPPPSTISGSGRTSSSRSRRSSDALQVAARAIRETKRPVGLVMWRGRHAWVMSGFESIGDPAIHDDVDGHRHPGPRPAVPERQHDVGAVAEAERADRRRRRWPGSS